MSSAEGSCFQPNSNRDEMVRTRSVRTSSCHSQIQFMMVMP